ncbi:LysR substrate-binding domain-containing protein [Amaricoccus solimangrovi]|uniref:LysR family transcriptional regulator n=1 Tax=Amaricoccus solimangrovi TaxID=2589815 RepID=A0A501WPQ7_9RHOB|nr:LysR substrate-binding domain-containing protein [Amaricoccus solimangrovi]TPE51763.1 LysR family transcriptional regulator [Amaricoccus solimangrovi]
MAHRYYQLPSLTALAAFEAAARHRSVHRAAQELNVTPGAVSRQIKALEEDLGTALFTRGRTGLTLTADAEALHVVLSQAFGRAAETIQAIRGGNRARRVVLACTHAFATFWLMPRIGDFWRRFPEISVDHVISDDARDFQRAEVDLRVRYGLGDWPGESSTPLMTEMIYPVAGRGFAERYAGRGPADIPELPLLHVDWADAEWTGWDELLRRGGVPHGALAGRRFGTFGVVIQACQEDQGLAVGWHRLVRGLVDEGRIVPFTGLRIASPGSYYLSWNDKRDLSGPAATLRDWFLETARADDV